MAEGDDQLTLRTREQGAQKLFIDTAKISVEKWEPSFGQENWAAICLALYQSIEAKEWREECIRR